MLSLNFEDFGIALRDLSGIMRITSFVLLLPVPVTLYFAEFLEPFYLLKKISVFAIPAAISYILYLVLEKKFRSDFKTKTKHAMLTVALAWLIIAIIGSLPYILSNTLDPLNSFFESMSGWTTTGMTMLRDIENTERGILFYRSLTQWVGGVGIIALALVVFMRKGTVAIQYYASEVGSLKLKPSIKSTVIETWKIYGIYTLACMILLYLAGMTPFDAINHSLTTLPTGGFSTHSESIAYFHSPLIEFTLIIFMLIGGLSFILHFRIFEGKSSYLLKNIESKNMLIIIFIATVICFYGLYDTGVSGIGTSLFQVVSIMTTTGFGTSDVGQWVPLSKTVLLILMVIGSCYGSTGGGMKVLRVVVVMKSVFYAIKKSMLPRTAVVRLKIDDKPLGYDEISHVMAFFTSYLLLLVMGTGVFTALNYGGYDSLSLSASAMANIGQTYVTGDAWFSIPAIGKLTLIFLMWIGRLEIFPVLVLFNSMIAKRRS